MCNPCPKKLTINLALESIDSLKQKASKLKNIDCPKKFLDPCLNRLQVVPAPIKRIKKKQIEICRCPTTDFICPPIPCICPPCPICPTPAERLKYLLKTGLKLAVLYALVRWTLEQELWGSSEHTSKLTIYYKSIVNALIYGEEESFLMSMKSPPGFFEVRKTVYQAQLLWNKLVTTFFYITVGLPVYYIDKIKQAILGGSVVSEADDEEEEEDEDEELEVVDENDLDGQILK